MSSIKSYYSSHVEHQIYPLSIDTPTTDLSAPSLSDKVAQELTRENYKLKDKNGDGQITVSYKFFDSSDPDTSWLKESGALAFSQARRKAFKSAIQAWEDVVKVKFTENAKEADAFFVLHANPGVGGYAVMPNDQGTANIGIGVGDKNSPLHSSMIHELGHSLGLGHPIGDYLENNHTHTAMSYRNKWWRPANERGVRVSDSNLTPAMHDIAAAHLIYRPNNETRKGNTTYGFNSNTERDHYTLTSADDLTNFCVWDNGGEDTLDFSGFKQNQKINLTAETLSDVGGRVGNVSIAKGVVMENAIGGTGHDVLIGNHVNNRLTGGAGRDTLIGGGGADTFVYNKASDSTPGNPDVLEDFTSGVDKIDLSRVLKDAGIEKPELVSVLTGRKGELMLSYDENAKMHKLVLNVSGKPDSALLILSKRPIALDDILTHSDSKPEPGPEPKPTPVSCRRPDTHDTVYGFNANTGRPSTTLTSACDTPYFSVDDRKGNDTLDFSGFYQDQQIDLTPGTRSSVGGLRDNVFITQTTVIENAIGGKGNDRISGNSADNILIGGAGADHLTGNGGFNTFSYHFACDSPRNNADTLLDFTTGKDKIDLRKMSENAQVKLNYVNQYRNQPGDTIIVHNPFTGRYFLGVDLTGDGKTDFLIKSTRPISNEDVIGLNIQDDGYM
jgi:serralysin